MDKKSILAFVFIFIIIISWPYYNKIINPNSEQTEQANKPATPAAPPNKQPQTLPVKTQDTAPKPIIETKSFQVASDGTIGEETLSIETELYSATISSKGGGSITAFTLKKYDVWNKNDTSLVEMLNDDTKTLFLSFISVTTGEKVQLKQNFNVIETSRHITAGNSVHITENDSFSITYGLSDAENQLATKTLTFYADKYSINLKSDISGLVNEMATNTYQLSWENGIPYSEPDITQEVRNSEAYAYSAGGEMEKFKIKEGKRETTKFEGNTHWTAIRTKYFAACFISPSPALGYQLSGTGVAMPGRKNFYKKFSMELDLPKNKENSTDIYIGPLDYNILKNKPFDLEKIMSLGGILRPIKLFVIWAFTNLYKVIPNYGFVLIIFAILIKLVLSPLTKKSMQSMKEMQKLQPEIAELREKHKDDSQKLNKATMALYKEHSVNPMGGCLPLLLQMPILIVLFRLFSTTIELRHAPFILWINDLSAPDALFTLSKAIPFYGQNINVLPLILILTQIFQQKSSGAASNPQQKSMMYVMPIMFFFIFNNLASGLNLYYILFNVLTMVQQKYLTPAAPQDKKKKKKRLTSFERYKQLQKQRKNQK